MTSFLNADCGVDDSADCTTGAEVVSIIPSPTGAGVSEAAKPEGLEEAPEVNLTKNRPFRPYKVEARFIEDIYISQKENFVSLAHKK